MTESIILLVDDLIFGSKLEALARQAGYAPHVASDEAALAKLMVKAPGLVLVDLRGLPHWERLVRFLKGPGKKNDHVPVLGFGPHGDLALRERALAAGCAAVVGRSAIVGNLPGLIKKHAWRINPALCAEPLPVLVQQGIEQFNAGKFYRCHETLEDAWNAEPRPVRILYQGILQIAVGYFHITQQNWRGAVKVLERGLPKTARFQPRCRGIDVAGLVAQAQAVYDELVILGPERITAFDKRLLGQISVDEQGCADIAG